MPRTEKNTRRTSTKRNRENSRKVNGYLAREMKLAQKIHDLEQEIEDLNSKQSLFGRYTIMMKETDLRFARDQLQRLEHERNRFSFKLETSFNTNSKLNGGVSM